MDLQRALTHYFPGITVNLSNYPPTPANVCMFVTPHAQHSQPQEVLAQLAKYVQFGVIAFALAAEYLAANFHAPIPPDTLEWWVRPGCNNSKVHSLVQITLTCANHPG